MGENFSLGFCENIRLLSERLGVRENFDVICRRLSAAAGEIAFFYIDGFVKDGVMQRTMQFVMSEREIGTAEELERRIPYVEVEVSGEIDKVLTAVLSGQTAMLSPSFGDKVILIDTRTYPARGTEEPEGDRVMQGARDGCVETLVTNTALIRRRVRDERLRMEYFNLGGSSKTDVVVCYIDGVADGEYLEKLRSAIRKIRPRSLTLGFQSLAETLIRSGWYNPFPKIRTTERPDTAAAHLVEGSVLV